MSDFIIKLVLVLLPMYVANSSAMLFGGKYPLDFGKKFFDKRPIFGPGKTFRGAIVGITLGTLCAFIVSILFPQLLVNLTKDYVLFGFLVSVGAIVGDIVASFFKRRNNIAPGEPVLFLDQLDFVIGALLFGSILYVPDFVEAIIIAVVTIVVHKAANLIAFKVKLKKVPW